MRKGTANRRHRGIATRKHNMRYVPIRVVTTNSVMAALTSIIAHIVKYVLCHIASFLRSTAPRATPIRLRYTLRCPPLLRKRRASDVLE